MGNASETVFKVRSALLPCPTPRRRFLLVHNPTAGVAHHPLFGRVIKGLEAAGARVIRAPDCGRGGLPLPLEDFDAIIAAGGDGTIRALAAAAGAHPIGILPVGTGNVFAREIGMPKDAPGIAHVLMHGPAVEIEGARAHGEPFFLMAGVGFDGEVVRHLDLAWKRRVGRLAYSTAVLKALKDRAPKLRVTVDGTTHEARWVVAANARHYGGAFVVASKAGLLRPGLEVVMFKSQSKLAALRQLAMVAIGRVSRDPDVTVLTASHLLVEADAPAAVEVDGDAFDTTPLVIEAGGPKLTMIVPEEFPAREQQRVQP